MHNKEQNGQQTEPPLCPWASSVLWGLPSTIPFLIQLASITASFSLSKQQSIENSVFRSSKWVARKSEMQGNKEHLIIRISPLAVEKPHSLASFQG